MAGERILIVDDEPQILQLCRQILTREGYQIQTAGSGEAGIACLEAESFDLLVVDIRMPDVDGLTVLRRARDLDPDLTAVVITGYATLNRAIAALHAGARGFIFKPFDVEGLVSAIGEALAQRQKDQERLRLKAQLPILEISQALLADADVETLASQLLEVTARQTGAQRALLMLLEEDAHWLYEVATSGLAGEASTRLRLPARQGLAGQALQASEPLVVDVGSQAILEQPLRAVLVKPDTAVLVFVPLSTRKRTVGVLGLSYPASTRSGVPFAPSLLSLLSITAGQIAIALENARLYATEQQRTAELARALEQQRELDRLKNEFIRNVSHELRTPLAMVLAYAELLASGTLGEVKAEQQGPLDIILQRALVLRDLVENITAILASHGRKPAWGPISLSQLVRDGLADSQALADQSGIALHGDIAEQVAPVQGDAGHLRKVVDNLIANALKFTPAGGAVTVSLYSAKERVVLRVTDTGIGIAADHQERIFERFYQADGSTRRRYGGSGLGLALVKEIVEAHGGAVTVESRLGQGSTFEVWLPVAIDHCPEPNVTVVVI
jgi:signal transduction histidine kinase